MRYRKKPIVIDAMQFTDESKDRVYNWIVGTNRCADFDKFGQPILKIETLEGIMIVNFGDWVIKGVEGEFYPCKPKIFEQTCEKV